MHAQSTARVIPAAEPAPALEGAAGDVGSAPQVEFATPSAEAAAGTAVAAPETEEETPSPSVALLPDVQSSQGPAGR